MPWRFFEGDGWIWSSPNKDKGRGSVETLPVVKSAVKILQPDGREFPRKPAERIGFRDPEQSDS